MYILRRGAEDLMTRNIHCPKLYEALDYLELTLDKAWLVKRYRHVVLGDDRRKWRASFDRGQCAREPTEIPTQKSD